ncbi:AAA ATPase domain-containing protein [Myxococcus virescens]|uniref:AAA ATPase domain-containing protein n=1 Tax=Myxococcus virescens TaxID=83456 RepID=A0ABY0NBE9_9BACT|nr:AAA ATPase domain-containing protein [Myxococcus virescens]
MTQSTPTQIGPYRLRHLLGSGGMGQVFAADHERMGGQVALKVLSSSAAKEPQRVARFLQEARALALLKHAGVVRILDCDQVDDTAYLAMEYLEGQSLRQWMQTQARIPLSSALAICAQIAATMVDVHAQGIVHRDLKPENIFLCPDPSLAADHRVKLLDFGIAKVPEGQADLLATQVHTHEATLIGTFRYMAPEQLLSAAKVDGAADVYALGVVLFELLAGRPPFDAKEPVLVISAHQREPPPPLKQFAPAVPSALASFISDMLEKQPVARPDMTRCRAVFERAWALDADECPVPGLAPFTEAHAELFFGRQVEARGLLERLEEARLGTRRWVQLEGPSGVGKSSLIQAALLPGVKALSSEEGPRWLIATMRPSDTPLRHLAEALVAAYAAVGVTERRDDLEASLRSGPVALHDFVTKHTPSGFRLLLVLEPMEELFTLGSAELAAVDALLSAALAAPETPLRLFTSLRSDFIHRLEQMPSLPHHLHAAARFPLLPMGDEALSQVVQGMAGRARLRLSEGLAERMVQDVRSEGGRLPLLGHTLQRMWMLSGGAPLTHEHYERLGGVGGALALDAEALLERLGEAGKQRAKWLLLELVQVGRGTPDTRRPRSRKDVLAAAGDDALAEQVLHRLSGIPLGQSPAEPSGLRLVVLSGERDPSLQRVELVHETLLHRVPSLVSWLERERVLLERQSDLEGVANAWEQAHRPLEGLPTGTLLEHYRRGFDSRGRWDAPALSPRAKDFLRAAERLSRRRIRARWLLMGLAALASLAILFYAVRAEQERRHAQENLQHLVKVADRISADADWDLSRLAHTLNIRRAMLTKLDESLTALSMDERAQRPVRLASVRVAHRMGDAAYYSGSLAAAERRFSEARRMMVEGLADDDLQWQLALNDSKLGKVAMARGQWARADAHLLASLRHMEAQPQVGDEAIDIRRSLAVSLSELAELRWAEGRVREAAALLDRAISLHAQNSDPYNEALLSVVLSQRGELAVKEGALGEAEAVVARASRLSRNARAARGGEAFFLWPVGRALVAEGHLLAAAGRLREAEARYVEAQRLGQALLDGEPPNKRYALMAASALQGREDVSAALGLDAPRAESREGRCTLVRRFLAQDPEDVRFQALTCEGTNP